MVALVHADTMPRIIDHLQADLGLSDAEMATTLGVPVESLRRWRSGVTNLGAEPSRRLHLLTVVAAHLGETFKAPGGSHWLRSESGYLGGQRPIDALLDGKFDRVESALEAIDSGIFI